MTEQPLTVPQPPAGRAGGVLALSWVPEHRWVSVFLDKSRIGPGSYWWSVWRSINSTTWTRVTDPQQIPAGTNLWEFDVTPPDDVTTPVMYAAGARATASTNGPELGIPSLGWYPSTINVPPVGAKPYRIHATVTPFGRVDLSVTTHPPMPGDGSVQPWTITQGARTVLALGTTRSVTDQWPSWSTPVKYDLKDTGGNLLDTITVMVTPVASILWDATTGGTGGRVRADIQSFTETYRQTSQVMRGVTVTVPPPVLVDSRSWREGEIRFVSRDGRFTALEGLLASGKPLAFMPPCTEGVAAPAQMTFLVKSWSRGPLFPNNPKNNPARVYVVQYEELWPGARPGTPYG